jgi:hypothetical protein
MYKFIIPALALGLAAGGVHAEEGSGNSGRAAAMGAEIGSFRDGGESNVGDVTRDVSGGGEQGARSGSGWGNQSLDGGAVSEGKPGRN